MTESALFSETTAVRASANQPTQWRAQTFQMVNWGGFHGYKAVDLSPASTLITGASGTGKSTMLDAYLALMTPSDTPFNAASNDAATGKARTGESRSIVTYLRGKMDSTADAATGRMKDVVLRSGTQWGGIAMTFVDDHGRQFTALRVYRVPATANAYRDLTKQLGTYDGFLDLRNFAEISDTKFDKRTIRAHVPGIRLADGPEDFAATLYARLGIGANGNGAMAIRLLARVQAGMPVPSVDRLYKQMVLERPITYEKAETAIRHFEALEESYREMKQESEKEAVLARIPNLHDDIQTAQATIDQVDTFKHDREGTTPFHLWRLNAEFNLLDVAEALLAEQHATEGQKYKDAEEAEAELRRQIAQNEAEQRSNGQDTLERLDTEISDLTRLQGEIRRAVAQFEDEASHVVGLAPATQADYDRLQVRAKAFLDDYEASTTSSRDERDRLRDIEGPLVTTLSELTEERDLLNKRAGLVPPRLDRLREAVSEASGIPVADLPFVAELIDLKPGEDRWRKAAEVALFAPARVMLVNADDLDHLSTSIDHLRLPGRINFEGVEHAAHTEVAYDPTRVSGKLAFKDSPFSRWVQNRVRGNDVDALCVEGPQDLRGHGLRVTVNGQTRSGKKGAHGEIGDKPIIGFSNEARRAEVEAEIVQVSEELAAVRADIKAVENNSAGLREQHAAFMAVARTRWADIDAQGNARALESKQAERTTILNDNQPLKALKDAHDRLDEEREAASIRKHAAKDARDKANKKYLAVVDDKDTLGRAVEAIERAQEIILEDEQVAYLDALFAEVAIDPTDHERFARNATLLKNRLSERTRTAHKDLEQASLALQERFAEYQRNWRDDTLGGTGLDAYDNYAAVLQRIRDTGLGEKKDEWRLRMGKWSSEDLVPLDGAFAAAFAEIDHRLDPVNRVLSTLPFSPKGYRLEIRKRVRASDDFQHFRAELESLASGTSNLTTADQLEDQFNRLHEFMKRIQEPKSGGSTASREHLLDIRQHIEITAVALDHNDVQQAVYATLGGKSGGESQELVAFIVGAALRYQLGDEERDRPRFAPVFLDEGFVKSDGEFANRAVQAWKQLGFQLIVGAPVDKVRALLPSMDQALLVTKNGSGHSHISTITETSIAATQT